MWSVTQGILEYQFTVFDCKLYTDLLFSLLKTVQLTTFYCKITWNVWLELLQFFPVYSTGTYC